MLKTRVAVKELKLNYCNMGIWYSTVCLLWSFALNSPTATQNEIWGFGEECREGEGLARNGLIISALAGRLR